MISDKNPTSLEFKVVQLGEILEVLTDYHANGAYEKLKDNVTLLDEDDYALMIRTTNFENNDFTKSVKYITRKAYNFLEKSKVYPGDLIMNKIANAGSIYLMPNLNRPVSLAMNLFLLRINSKKANPIYVYIYLKVNEAYVKQFANGSVTKTITKESVRKLEIKLPERQIQDYISNFYMDLTNKIDLNVQVNDTLENIALLLFKSWFIDFEPVRTKVEGRKPENLSEEIAKMFPNKLVDSPLGEIPKGWKNGKLSNILLQHKLSANPNNDQEKEFLHYSLPAYDMGKNPVKEKAISIKSIKTYVVDNAVLLSKLNPEIPRVWLTYPEKKYPSICSTEFLVYTAKNNFSSEYLFCLFCEKNFRFLLQGMVTGTSRSHQRVQPQSVLKIDCIIPPDNILESFNMLVIPIFKKIHQNNQQSAILSELRNILFSKLISGEFRLSNVLGYSKEASKCR